jgi:hypothetical protein
MKTFKSITGVEKLSKHPLHATVQSLVSTMIADCPEHRPEDDGWLVLMEPDDTTRALDDLDMPCPPGDSPTRTRRPRRQFSTISVNIKTQLVVLIEEHKYKCANTEVV